MSVNELKAKDRKGKNERGVALMVALFSLLLLGAIAMAMTFMSDTETAINANYRDAQVAYFGAQAGLEEARDRLRVNGPVVNWDNNTGTSEAIPPPTLLPTLANGAVYYITNPDDLDGANGVQPWNPANAYFDEELCHEQFSGLAMGTPPALNVPCPKDGTGHPAGSGWYTEYASASPQRLTPAALPYKWVRITLKQNRTNYPYNVSEPGVTTPTNLPDSRVCWHGVAQRQYVIAANGNAVPIPENPEDRLASLDSLRNGLDGLPYRPLVAFAPKGKTTTTTTTGTTTTTTTGTTTTTTGSGYVPGVTGTTLLLPLTGDPDPCQQNSASLFSVYVITTLSVTRNGSRRMTQYEVARAQIQLDLPSAFTFNGQPITYIPPSSAVFTLSGIDGCGGGDNKVALGAIDDAGCQKTEDSDGSPPTCNSTTPCNDPSDTNGGSFDETQIMSPKHCASDYVRDVAANRPDNYAGDCSPMGNPTACSGDVTSALANPANPMRTSQDLRNLRDTIKDQADFNVTNAAAVTDWGTQASCATCVDGDPKVIFVDGDATIPAGAGVVIDTGTATITGNTDWQGAILVIGKGRLVKGGGGGGNTQGGIMVANIECEVNNSSGCTDSDPAVPENSSVPGGPYFDFNGGGNSTIQYNSCMLNNGGRRPYYGILSYREMTY